MAQTELTRMFASLGFKVDDTGAAQFESRLRALRENSALFARNLGVVANKLSLVKKKVDALNRSLASDSKSSKSKNNKGMSESYSRLANYVERVEQSHKSITTHEPVLVKALNNIRTTVWKGSNAWEAYRKNVSSANNEMRSFKQSMADMRRGTGSVAVNNKYYGGNQPSPRPSVAHPPQSPTSAGGAMMFGALGGGVKDFFRSMTPATAIAGGLVSAGFAVKEVVQTGREMTKMNNVLLMAASGQEQYARALQFVNKESNRLGQDVQEMGMAFGKVLQSARGKMKYEDVEKVFTGFGELMTAMGANVEDQKGIYRAFGQMLTKGKIEAEEEGQIAERGLPAKELIKQSAMEVYGVDSAGYEKMRQKGAVKIEDIAVNLSNRMRAMANNNDALNKMLQTSAVAQQRLMNSWKNFAQALMNSGLDKALFWLFTGLSKLLEVLTPLIASFKDVVSGVGQVIKVFYNLAQQNTKLLATVLTLGLAYVALTGQTTKTGIVTKILTGDLKNLMTTKNKLRLRTIALTGAVLALGWAFSQIAGMYNGEDNWASLLGLHFELLFIKVDILKFKILTMFERAKWAFKDLLPDLGIVEKASNFFSTVGRGLFPEKKDYVQEAIDRQKERERQQRIPKTILNPNMQSSNINRDTKLRIDTYTNGVYSGTTQMYLGDTKNLTLTG